MAVWLVWAAQNLSAQSDPPAYWAWAQKPPMGWNSYDCFGAAVTEAQAKANADYMAANLKAVGYQYIVIDIRWYDPNATSFSLPPNAAVTVDQYGRLLPATNRFPSASNGVGFKALADYVHNLGLKFGIHVMRGIARAAYNQNTAILGTPYHARDVADVGSTCRWDDDMYGVDVTRPGGQEYYNSLAALWASWGVDFVKIDDLTSDPGLLPRPYHAGEVEAIRKAIDQTGRPIVFSTSPGATPLGQGPHVMQEANMWRIDDDFWDVWSALLNQFTALPGWTLYRRPGHFPDADMLPLGKIAIAGDPNGGRATRFTADEQRTLMTLWSIARSPLMFGGNMPQNDAATLALITNPEVLGVNQNSEGNRQLFNQSPLYAWVGNVPNSTDRYLAVFNTQDPVSGQTGTAVTVNLSDVGFTGQCQIRDLWQRASLGSFTGQFSPTINWHGAGLYRISGTYIAKPPSTLLATPGSRSVELIWDSVSGAQSYNLYRSNTSGGPYALVANGIIGTDYVDQPLTNGSTYYYVISAVTNVGTSGQSTEVSAMPIGDLIDPWLALDIGYPAFTGRAGFSDGIHILHAGGMDIWQTIDDFRFQWKQMTGDGTLICRVRSLEHSDDWAKAGVMFREDGTAGSRYAFMFANASGLVALQYRDTPNNNSGQPFNGADTDTLRWVKLIRKTNTFYGYYSSDGMSWQSASSSAVTMAQKVYAGLAVTAHNNDVPTTATFDFVSFVPASAALPAGSFRILDGLRSGSDALVVIPSTSGQTYRLQKTSSLVNPSWQNVGSSQTGTGDFLTFFDSGGATGNRAFYKVIQGSGVAKAEGSPAPARSNRELR